ncbi:MAG: hypothetical protein UHD05_10240 [Ruminococcus sp.]|nr:hypothetical protein [Ruminococcus sp.]
MSDSCCNSDSQQGNMCNSVEVLNRIEAVNPCSLLSGLLEPCVVAFGFGS